MSVKGSTELNSTYGRELAITVMKVIQRQHTAGQEVTVRSITNTIAEETGMHRGRALEERVGNCVRGLARAGHLERTLKPNGEKIPYHAITPRP